MDQQAVVCQHSRGPGFIGDGEPVGSCALARGGPAVVGQQARAHQQLTSSSGPARWAIMLGCAASVGRGMLLAVC